MTFIRTAIEVGDKVVTTQEIRLANGVFTKGHEFTVIDIGGRGYDLQDADGRKVLEASWEKISKVVA